MGGEDVLEQYVASEKKQLFNSTQKIFEQKAILIINKNTFPKSS
jgi:hypothetical protein